VSWGTVAILVLAPVFAVLAYAYARADLVRRSCVAETGLGIAAAVLGTVALVRRSGRALGVIARVLGVVITLVSLFVLSWTPTWDSQAAALPREARG